MINETIQTQAKELLLKDCCNSSLSLRGDLHIQEGILSRITLESMIRDYELVEQTLAERITAIGELGGEPTETLSDNYTYASNRLQELRTLWDCRYHENKKLHDSSRCYWGVRTDKGKKS